MWFCSPSFFFPIILPSLLAPLPPLAAGLVLPKWPGPGALVPPPPPHFQPLLLFFFCFSCFHWRHHILLEAARKLGERLTEPELRPEPPQFHTETAKGSHSIQTRIQAVKHGGGRVMMWDFLWLQFWSLKLDLDFRSGSVQRPAWTRCSKTQHAHFYRDVNVQVSVFAPQLGVCRVPILWCDLVRPDEVNMN